MRRVGYLMAWLVISAAVFLLLFRMTQTFDTHIFEKTNPLIYLVAIAADIMVLIILSLRWGYILSRYNIRHDMITVFRIITSCVAINNLIPSGPVHKKASCYTLQALCYLYGPLSLLYGPDSVL